MQIVAEGHNSPRSSVGHLDGGFGQYLLHRASEVVALIRLLNDNLAALPPRDREFVAIAGREDKWCSDCSELCRQVETRAATDVDLRSDGR
jgi:hypothetical protein